MIARTTRVLVVAAIAVAALALVAQTAQAGVHITVTIGGPAVIVRPAPVIVQPTYTVVTTTTYTTTTCYPTTVYAPAPYYATTYPTVVVGYSTPRVYVAPPARPVYRHDFRRGHDVGYRDYRPAYDYGRPHHVARR